MRTKFENLRVYQMSEILADEIWDIVGSWNNFAKDTLGKQIVRAADSVGANIAEGEGRGTHSDNRRFIRIARGSLQEALASSRIQTKLIINRTNNKLKPLIENLSPSINAYLASIGKTIESESKNQKLKTKNQKL